MLKAGVPVLTRGGVRFAGISAILAGILAFSGCDPGYSYKPIAKDGTLATEWSSSIDGVDFGFRSFGELVGCDSLRFGPEISNQSEKTVVLLGGRLTTGGQTIKAILPGYGNLKFRTVLPGEVRDVPLFWDLRGRLTARSPVVLGQKTKWTWRVRIGEKEHTVQFEHGS